MEKKSSYAGGIKNSQVRKVLKEKVEECIARLCTLSDELAGGRLTTEEFLQKSEERNRIDLRIAQLCTEYNKVSACKSSPDKQLNNLFKKLL